jgi:hypothetical protein
LGNWWSHVNGTEIDGIISTIKRDLKLKVILIVLRSISYFADKLSNVSVSPSTILSLLLSIDKVTIFKHILVSLLSKTGDLFLS